MKWPQSLAKIWDALAWLAVGAVWVTGGAVIRLGGTKIELTQIGLHSAILLALALLLHWRGISVRETSFCRLWLKAWRLWQRLLSLWPALTLLLATMAVGFFWFVVAAERHRGLHSSAADLGIFTNAIWNLTHGHGYFSSIKGGVHLLSDHQSPLFYLLGPLFSLWPSPYLLLLVQALALAAAGASLFYLAKRLAPDAAGLPAVLPLVFWNYLPLRNANAFDFHPEILMLPLFLWSVVGLWGKRTWGQALGAALFLLALGAKESAPVVGMGLALALFFGAAPTYAKRKLRFLAPLLALFSAAVFYFNFRWLPGYMGFKQAYVGSYAGLGNTVSELLLSPFYSPLEFFRRLTALSRLKFLWATLAPLAFLPLFSRYALWALAPGYFMLFLTTGDHRVTTGFHYALEPAVGLFLALPIGVFWAAKRWGQKPVLFALVAASLLMTGRSEVWRARTLGPSARADWLRTEVLPCLSEQPTAASNAFVPHISDRWWIHYLPELKMPDDTLVGCVLRDPAVDNWPMNTSDAQRLDRLLEREFQVSWRCGSVTLYERKGTGSTCQLCQPSCPEI